ncbi:MAG: acyl carrier protein [Tannerella sp.]|nr:acyl carrier protein [Tannerella sp.]
MNLKQFIRNFAEQFDETDMDISVFQENTVFKELNIWSSMVALSVIVMIDDIYDVHIGGHEIMTADTIEELFNTVKNILSEQ